MNAENPTNHPSTNRRSFLKSSAATAAVIGLASSRNALAASNKNSRLRVFQIGVGGIGAMQRRGLEGHAGVEWAGFCDVDRHALDRMEKKFPDAFLTADYREAFADRVDEFDAVIVDTPDFHHAPMMVRALKHGKHVYGQKPLVHQLDEIRMIREILAMRPGLYTQMGNQRACNRGRMQAVELLKSNRLGRPVEAHIWTGAVKRGKYFVEPWSPLPEPQSIPPTMAWDLWNGPLQTKMPYSKDVAPRRWRSYWETGGGQLADWACHLFDALYFAYDLASPEAVQTNTIRPANQTHSGYNQCTLTYPGGENFAREKFVVYYNDSHIRPSFASLGLPISGIKGNCTMVVCEEGTLMLEPGGRMEIYRNGKLVGNEPMPEVEPRNHWKDWADCCLGNEKPLWTPFEIGTRITEPALLSVKATRFPNRELRWDGANYRFTNHEKANEQLLSRTYREGFAPPEIG